MTEEEKRFLAWWQEHRTSRKKLIWKLAAGLPLSLVLAGGILVTYFSEWYTRAVMTIRMNTSGVLVLLVGLVILTVFLVVFSARHRWEMNEQRYLELKAKRNKEP